MGRNAGSSIHFTHVDPGPGKWIIWYCQQHAMWSDNTVVNDLKDHLENFHGCVEQ